MSFNDHSVNFEERRGRLPISPIPNNSEDRKYFILYPPHKIQLLQSVNLPAALHEPSVRLPES